MIMIRVHFPVQIMLRTDPNRCTHNKLNQPVVATAVTGVATADISVATAVAVVATAGTGVATAVAVAV